MVLGQLKQASPRPCLGWAWILHTLLRFQLNIKLCRTHAPRSPALFSHQTQHKAPGGQREAANTDPDALINEWLFADFYFNLVSNSPDCRQSSPAKRIWTWRIWVQQEPRTQWLQQSRSGQPLQPIGIHNRAAISGGLSQRTEKAFLVQDLSVEFIELVDRVVAKRDRWPFQEQTTEVETQFLTQNPARIKWKTREERPRIELSQPAEISGSECFQESESNGKEEPWNWIPLLHRPASKNLINNQQQNWTRPPT